MTLFESARPPESPFSALRRRRRRRQAIVGSSIVAAVAAILSVVVVVIGPQNLSASTWFAPAAPSAEVVAIADKSFLTEQARQLLYATRPLVADRAQIVEQCGRGGQALGCYHPLVGIVVYQPADPRIADAAVTTLAHELLHAAYDGLGDGERSTVDQLLAVEIVRVPGDDPVHLQIESSVGEHESSRETELFAYLGSQIRLDGGFAPDLEAVYARYFTDRSALVDVHLRIGAVMDQVLAEAQAAFGQLGADEAANATARAQLDADRSAHEQARTQYNQDADRYNTLPADERGRWIATWTTNEGETVSQPLGESLAVRLAELEQYRVQLDDRASALADAEASVTSRRPQLEAQLADVESLLESAYPSYSSG